MTPQPLARHLLRARDLADARYAEPLTVRRHGPRRQAVARLLQPGVQACLRRVAAPVLLTRRLERAATLLRVTDWSVAEVCFAVGAGSVGSFTASFGRIFGRSPTAYRRSCPPAARFVRIPRCVVMPYARPQNRTFSRRPRDAQFVGFFR